mmetsp:Transcript_43448/g.123118  ORF Transcript_43448/g.123118 Transcript_43448/m.123118 type:complete len:351 (+) Transcript_43448:259-1311(+)
MDKAACERLKEAGNVHYREGRYDDAIKLYTDASDRCPHDEKGFKAIILANRAACHIQQGNYAAAVVDCTSAVINNPRYIKAYQRRSGAYEKQGKWRLALSDVNKVIELDPSQRVSLRDRRAMLMTRAKDEGDDGRGAEQSAKASDRSHFDTYFDTNTHQGDQYRLRGKGFEIVPLTSLPAGHPYKASYSTSDPVVRCESLVYPSFTSFAIRHTLPFEDYPHSHMFMTYEGPMDAKLRALATQPIDTGKDYLLIDALHDLGLERRHPFGRPLRYVVVYGHRKGEDSPAFIVVRPADALVVAALYQESAAPERRDRLDMSIRKRLVEEWFQLLKRFDIERFRKFKSVKFSLK